MDSKLLIPLHLPPTSLISEEDRGVLSVSLSAVCLYNICLVSLLISAEQQAEMQR